ncbi:uncharacterized protein LOC131996320 [Stomoxys calcitrans]|uniref:uncharacterized protein LOC131996320 n=1 Tax=Stomoxys calcitrans TaxID=35570 RepID=UPI0027E372E2|nr:uncharacterized protein LOC131996320 [Stomoxys calcitrans]
MYVKVLMQDVWRSKIKWDEKISPEIESKWKQWINIIPDIQTLKIPRCYLQHFDNFRDVKVQLHTFVDASKDGNFMARRGIPQEFYSDNGTNFVGAERELRESLKDVDKNEMVRTFTTTTTKWGFNPPASPHMGGAWERLVRSVKTILYKIMPSRSPSDELLLSMLIEVENIIHSRPLAYVPLHSETDEALTPNHFLLGSSNGLKPMSECSQSGILLRKGWLISQQYANIFWKKWVAQYLPSLTCRSKWFEKSKPLSQGDLVIIVDPSLPRNVWLRGKVLETRLARDGQVRSAKVLTKHGILDRPAAKLAVLEVELQRESGGEESSGHTGGGMLTQPKKLPEYSVDLANTRN